jgi:hypothetical protein
MTDEKKCGKVAGALIPRLGMWYACVLEPGHEGECQRGGTCFKHGDYVGETCPHWPECITLMELLGKEVPATVALDNGATRRVCNHPDCPNDWPCEVHKDMNTGGKTTVPDGITRAELTGKLVRVDLEERQPCGHRKANIVGDEGGTPYCEVCEAREAALRGLNFKEVQGFTGEASNRAAELVRAVFVGPVPDSVIWAVAMAFDRAEAEAREAQAATCGVPIPYKVTPTEKDRQRALAFQHRLDGDVSSSVGDRVWWASIRFPDVLAAEYAQVRLEGTIAALEEKNWVFKNVGGTAEIDFPATLRAVGEAAVEEYRRTERNKQ